MRAELTYERDDRIQDPNTTGRPTKPKQGTFLLHPGQKVKGATSPKKATSPRQGNIAVISNTQEKKQNHKETAIMGKQRNRPQMKQQEESPEKDLNEMEASNFSETEYNMMVLMLNKETA